MSVENFMRHATAVDQDVAMNIRSLVARHLGVDARRVSDDARFVNDLGADWLDRLELMIVVEEHFDVEFADDDLDRLVAVGDLIRFIEDHRQLKAKTTEAS